MATGVVGGKDGESGLVIRDFPCPRRSTHSGHGDAVFPRQLLNTAGKVDKSDTGAESRLRSPHRNAANGGLIHASPISQISLAESFGL